MRINFFLNKKWRFIVIFVKQGAITNKNAYYDTQNLFYRNNRFVYGVF